jgi:RNA polymerase sigma-70 factor (ECF subfamily)
MRVGNLTNIFDLPQTAARADEAALVQELRAGSEEAFAWLIAQYHRPIYSLLARSVRDPSDAADITQEVFLKVFRGIHSFHGESSLKTWIYRIALHEASNGRRWWTRHKKCEVTLEQDAYGSMCSGDSAMSEDAPTLGEMLVDVHGTPYDKAAQAEVKARVEAALAEVQEPFRTAVILRDVEGFAYDEMAEILQISIGTVKSRIVRGRAALKQRLSATQPAVRMAKPVVSAAAGKPTLSVQTAVPGPVRGARA